MVAIDIRLARDSDVDAIAEIYRPIVESTTLSFETRAPDQEEMASEYTRRCSRFRSRHSS